MSGRFVDLTHHVDQASYGVSVNDILRCCYKRVLYPYLRLISILGWRPLFFSTVEPPLTIRCSNILYLSFIIVTMLMGHVLEYASCHSDIISGKEAPKFLHILPNLFHVSSYFAVMYYSRKPESERLVTLMESVFLQSSGNAGWLIYHKRLMKQLRNFFIFCIVWVLASFSMRLLHFFWYETVHRHAWMCNYDWPLISGSRSLTAMRIVCSSWNDLICAAIVTTYSVHCQLNISYISNLCTTVRERRIPIQEFFKRVEESSNFIDYLNGDQSIGVSLLMMNLICRAGISAIALLHPPETEKLSWRASSVLALSLITCVSLIYVNLRQSLRLTNACKELHDIGHELISLHPAGKSGDMNEQDDLNSLVLYTSTLNMGATILKIPVRAPCLSILLIALTFMLLLLAQFGYINF